MISARRGGKLCFPTEFNFAWNLMNIRVFAEGTMGEFGGSLRQPRKAEECGGGELNRSKMARYVWGAPVCHSPPRPGGPPLPAPRPEHYFFLRGGSGQAAGNMLPHTNNTSQMSKLCHQITDNRHQQSMTRQQTPKNLST